MPTRAIKELLRPTASRIAKSVAESEKKVYARTAPESPITETPQGLVIRAAPEEDLDAFNSALFGEEADFGLNMGRIGELLDPSGELNLGDALANLKNENKELFEYLRRSTKSMEELVALAENSGANEIAYKFLTRKPSELLAGEDVVGGLLLINKLHYEIRTGAQQALDLPPEQREEAFKRIQILATVQARMAASVSGNVSEMGRGLATVSHVAKLAEIDTSDYAAQIDEMVNQMDDGLVDYHLQAFATLPKESTLTYAKRSFLSRTWDAAMESYVMSLISSPVTHAVNIVGNAGFQGLTLAERGLAGAIGGAREAAGMTMDGSRVYSGEAAAELHGMMMSQLDALKLAGKTFVTGESGDFATKIDLRNMRSIGNTDNLMEIARQAQAGDYSGTAINALGVFTRLPGRFLATEDEYFKVVTRQRAIYREAYIAQTEAFQQARAAGMDVDQAQATANEAYLRVMYEPNDAIERKIAEEAKQMTFQGKPKGLLGSGVGEEASQVFGQAVQYGPMRTVVPFYKTPQNVMNETFDRTLNWSTTYRALRAGKGREFDEATAKLAIGNTIFFTFAAMASGLYGDDVIINGKGPERREQRKMMRAAGIPPYSIGFKQEDGSYRYITYSRFDPMSGILAMSADYAYYAKNSDDMMMVEKLARAGTLGAADYATNMPFLQGVSELTMAVGGYGTTEDFFERMSLFMGKKAGDVAMNIGGHYEPLVTPFRKLGVDAPFIGSTSFQATLERVGDPTLQSRRLPEGAPYASELLAQVGIMDEATKYTDLPAPIRGFYEAVQYAKTRSPRFSEDLEPALNFWGSEMSQTEGRWDEYFNPMTITTGMYSDLDLELNRLSDTGAGAFSNHPKKIDGIGLNATQINTLVRYTNEVDARGRLPGEDGYDIGTNLINSLDDQLKSTEYVEAIDDLAKYGRLSGILRDRREAARSRFINEDPELSVLLGGDD